MKITDVQRKILLDILRNDVPVMIPNMNSLIDRKLVYLDGRGSAKLTDKGRDLFTKNEIFEAEFLKFLRKPEPSAKDWSEIFWFFHWATRQGASASDPEACITRALEAVQPDEPTPEPAQPETKPTTRHLDDCQTCSYHDSRRYPLKYLWHFVRDRVRSNDLTTVEVGQAEEVLVMLAGEQYFEKGEAR